MLATLYITFFFIVFVSLSLSLSLSPISSLPLPRFPPAAWTFFALVSSPLSALLRLHTRSAQGGQARVQRPRGRSCSPRGWRRARAGRRGHAVRNRHWRRPSPSSRCCPRSGLWAAGAAASPRLLSCLPLLTALAFLPRLFLSSLASPAPRLSLTRPRPLQPLTAAALLRRRWPSGRRAAPSGSTAPSATWSRRSTSSQRPTRWSSPAKSARRSSARTAGAWA